MIDKRVVKLTVIDNDHYHDAYYLYTWEQLPLLAVLKSAIRTANLGSSIHTFFCGLELPPLAVLWSLHRTADLGSSNGSFRPW